MKKNNCKRLALFLGYILLAMVIMPFVNCTQKVIVEAPVVWDYVKEPEPLVLLNAEDIKQEITKLEIKLMLKDTVVSRDTMMMNLFHLFIHKNNPEPDYNKAILLIDSIAVLKGETQEFLEYLNWSHFIQKYNKLLISVDSVSAIVKESKLKNKSLEYSNKKLKKQQEKIDSLCTIINSQQETMNKLRKLDLKLEKQRNRIK